VANDEVLINTSRPLPTGRVGQIVEIITANEQEGIAPAAVELGKEALPASSP